MVRIIQVKSDIERPHDEGPTPLTGHHTVKTLLPTEYKHFVDIINFSSGWGSFPFKWVDNGKVMQLESNYSSKGTIRFALCWYSWFVYTTYLGYQLQAAIRTGKPFQEYYRILHIFLGFMLPGVALMLCIVREHLLLQFINATFGVCRWFAEAFTDINLTLNHHGFVIKLKFFLGVILPSLKLFSTANIPEEFHTNFVLLSHAIICLLVLLYFGGLLATFVGMSIFFSYIFLLCYYEINLNKHLNVCLPPLRQMGPLSQVYRTIQIVICTLNILLRDILLPVQVIVMLTVQYSNFVIIRYHKEVSILEITLLTWFSLIWAFGYLTLIHCAGLFNKVSKKALQSFGHLPYKTINEARYWRRVKKSMKPIEIHVGYFYPISTKTVLGIMTGYFKGTVKMLVLFDKHAKGYH